MDTLGRLSVIHAVQGMHDAVASVQMFSAPIRGAPPPAPGSLVWRENLAYRFGPGITTLEIHNLFCANNFTLCYDLRS